MLRHPPRSGRDRLGYLDAVRGLAVCLVLLQHFGEYVSSWVRSFSANWLQFGQLGVSLFFCCSGFIIPISLTRGGGARVFWTHRFFRLYPLYWLSMTGAALSVAWGFRHATFHRSDWLANLTMAQTFLLRPNVLGPYWTLAWELAFYVLMTVLFAFGWHRRSVPILLGIVATVLTVDRLPIHVPVELAPVNMFRLALILCGYAVYQWRHDELRGHALATSLLLTAAAGYVIASDARISPGTYVAWCVAVATFVAIARAAQTSVVPNALRRLGIISYSIYLTHPLVLYFLPLRGRPAPERVALWLAVTLAISELTYRIIERPAIQFGRRLTESPARRRAALGRAI